MRSDTVKRGTQRAPHRSLLRATGQIADDSDFDKLVPGMFMGAMRCNVPTIFVSGGPMEAGRTPTGKTVDLIDVFIGAAAHQQGKLSADELAELEQYGCPTCGSCSGMFTANSMNCLAEALGMALPGNGTLLAT